MIVIGYDKDNDREQSETMIDRYGRVLPKYTRGTIHLDRYTSSSHLLVKGGIHWFDQRVKRFLKVRRISITACQIIDEIKTKDIIYHEQMDLFSYDQQNKDDHEKLKQSLEKEKRLQQATLLLKQKYGKNSVLKAMNLQDGATAKERNDTIGGHKA